MKEDLPVPVPPMTKIATLRLGGGLEGFACDFRNFSVGIKDRLLGSELTSR